MELSTLCLGLLLGSPLSGYGIHQRISGTVGHFQHASFGALYPALGKLLAADLVRVDQTRIEGLGKKIYAITDMGRESFDAKLTESTKPDLFRSGFLSAMYFADRLPISEVERLIDQSLAGHQEQRRHLLALPISSMTEGQRFTVRYSLSQTAALIEFIQGEGRAILTSMQRERYGSL
jgi:PadR family transcriptional regulator, regulatory protein AphA